MAELRLMRPDARQQVSQVVVLSQLAVIAPDETPEGRRAVRSIYSILLLFYEPPILRASDDWAWLHKPDQADDCNYANEPHCGSWTWRLRLRRARL